MSYKGLWVTNDAIDITAFRVELEGQGLETEHEEHAGCALDIIAEREFDIIITDLNLAPCRDYVHPGIRQKYEDGYRHELLGLEFVREARKITDIPIAVVSIVRAHGDPLFQRAASRSFEAGATQYHELRVGINYEAMCEKIVRLAQSGSHEQGIVDSVGTW